MKTKIIEVLLMLFILSTIYLYIRNSDLKNRLLESNTHYPDTVYVNKPFEPAPPLPNGEVPERVLVYTSLRDQPIDQASQDSLVQFKLSNSQLDLTLFHKADSTVLTKEFKIDLTSNKYLYNNGILTSKHKLDIKPYIDTRIRPINQLYDVGAGIDLRTKHITYGIGVNIGYYPKLSDKIQKDIEFTLTYRF